MTAPNRHSGQLYWAGFGAWTPSEEYRQQTAGHQPGTGQPGPGAEAATRAADRTPADAEPVQGGGARVGVAPAEWETLLNRGTAPVDRGTVLRMVAAVHRAAYRVGYRARDLDDVTPAPLRTRAVDGPSHTELLALRGEVEVGPGQHRPVTDEDGYPGGPVDWDTGRPLHPPTRDRVEEADQAVTRLRAAGDAHRGACSRADREQAAAEVYRDQLALWHDTDHTHQAASASGADGADSGRGLHR